MSTLAFTVPGAPVPCARARVVRNPRTGAVHGVTEPRTRAFKERVALIARAAAGRARWAPPSGAAYELCVDVYRTARRGDADNYIKGIADALTRAGLWPDDRDVQAMTGRLFVDPERPRVDVEVRIIERDANPANASRGAHVTRGGAIGMPDDSRGVAAAKTRLRFTTRRQSASTLTGGER